METLPYRVMRSDGGVLKCLATFADDSTALTFYDWLVEDLHETEGSSPTVWIEEWKHHRWVLMGKVDSEESKFTLLQLSDKGSIDKKLFYHRITAGERDVLILGLDHLISVFHEKTRSLAIDEFKFMFHSTRIGEDAEGMGHPEIQRLILEPMQKLEKLKALRAWLRSRSIIVETTIIIPELF